MTFLRAAGGAVALLVIALAGGFLWLRGSLPQVDGTLRVAGLDERVTVTRDAHGIPRIVAASEHDAYFALGFVHAQDRLWQMEMQRRAGAGRLSEMFGPSSLGTDRFIRTLGIYDLAERSYEHMTPEARAALDAYAAGVNAWIDGHGGALPPEFVLLRHRPEPWRPADSLVWARLMALQLSGNWQEDLLRARVAARLPAERLRTLWPPYPADAPTTVVRDETAQAMLAATPDILQPRLASNVWAISGEHTATGKPVLANDPHLEFEAPILWYLAIIETPNLTLSGATVPGVPFHLLGHNGSIAWGITTTHSDTVDLFVEEETGAGFYRTPDGKAAFETRVETILVKDDDPVTITVRQTRHGPVISDVLGDRADGLILALAATALDAEDVTAQAFYNMHRARDWPAFVEALRDFGTPQQNVAYADKDGNIGFYVPGRVPVRRAGDGTVPAPGGTGEYDWVGWVPFEELPRIENPANGLIVNANNKVVADGYKHFLSAQWPAPYRAFRITELLAGQSRHEIGDSARIQADVVSLMERDLLARLEKVVAKDPRAAKAFEMLRDWNRSWHRDRPEPLIMAAWLVEIQQELLDGAVGELKASFPVPRPLFLAAALSGEDGWCPDSCGANLSTSLDKALDKLAAAYGNDMKTWRWGDAHQATFEHRFFRHIPVLKDLSRITIATDGGDFTVNRGTFIPAEGRPPFAHVHGAGYRAIYDLADLDNSLFIIATGQSGNLLSGHYRDLVEEWRDGRYLTLSSTRKPDGGVLTLAPAQ